MMRRSPMINKLTKTPELTKTSAMADRLSCGMSITNLICCLLAFMMMAVMTIAVMTVTSVPVYAAEDSTYEVYIDDSANLLTDEEESQLRSEMSELTSYGNMMFTTVTLSNGDYESYAEDAYYEKYGNEPGINFQIDMGNRKLTLSASTEMEKLIGSERDTIVDNIYEYATDEQYYLCASDCFQEIHKVLNNGRIAHKMKYINNAIVALILGLILNFLVVFATFRGSASKKYRKNAVKTTTRIDKVDVVKTFTSRRYSPIKTSSGGGHGGGGGFSGGGGGGGGFSGGSSSHGF